MSVNKGLTTWIIQTGRLTVAYRWNMNLRQACRTLGMHCGRRIIFECGPILAEWAGPK